MVYHYWYLALTLNFYHDTTFKDQYQQWNFEQTVDVTLSLSSSSLFYFVVKSLKMLFITLKICEKNYVYNKCSVDRHLIKEFSDKIFF